MATRVEELRKNLVSELYAFNMAMFRDGGGADEEVDALIAAAREEGVGSAVARLAFAQDDDRSEGKYPIVEQIERIGSMLGTLDEDTRLTVRQMLHDLADVARVDGRNQEKECIRRVLDLLSPAPQEADNDNR